MNEKKQAYYDMLKNRTEELEREFYDLKIRLHEALRQIVTEECDKEKKHLLEKLIDNFIQTDFDTLLTHIIIFHELLFPEAYEEAYTEEP